MSGQSLTDRPKIEVEYWKSSITEGPASDLFSNFLKKAGDARVLLELIRHYRGVFEGAERILELGAGQGWASCIVKRAYPRAYVIGSVVCRFLRW